MMPRTFRILVYFVLSAMILMSMVFAYAAANTIPGSRLEDELNSISANLVKPPDCSALNLTTIIVCSSGGGVCDGSDANELILGGPADDHINAGKGDDCLVGGGGDDRLRGNQGTDVCLGGPGVDDIDQVSCETGIE